MIANITKGSFLEPLIEYNEKKINNNEAKLLLIGNTIVNSKGDNGFINAKNKIAKLGYNSKRKDKFFHVSINFPEQDKPLINDDILKNIAENYMEKMGFENQPYLVYKHEDTNHPHIHIVSSNIDIEKKAISTSNDRRISQQITRDLEIKFNLTKVSSEKNIQIQAAPLKNDLKIPSLKNELNYHLKIALQKMRVVNQTELQKYLNLNNLDIQTLTGVKQINNKNIEYKGITFNKFDENFKQNQKGIKASSLYLNPTDKNLNKIFQRNTAYHKANRKTIKNKIDFIFNSYDKISLDDLKNKLKNKNIELNTKFDSKNNLVGISFTDLNIQYKYTGEQIGKQFTAKNINNKIGNTLIKPEVLTQIKYKKYSDKLINLNDNQKIQTLISLGFNIHYQNNTIYISDYQNKSGEGYFKLLENKNINTSTIDLYKNSKNIQFNNLTGLNKFHFEYNRAKFDNNIELMDKISNQINNLNQSPFNNVNDTKKELEDLYKDIYNYQNNDEDDLNIISDIDKKKKKGLFRKK